MASSVSSIISRKSLRLRASAVKRSLNPGFTLMELLLVLVIIGLLAALVGPTLYQRIKPAKESAARAQIENFATALDSYLLDVGRYPTTQEGLKALRAKPEGVDKWNGPYLKKDVPSDSWGNPFVYRAPGRNGGYEIISYGADGREGGEGDNADINSWEAK
ncbi:MAG: type II secretion system protein GspG [Candidatus Muproteobacteria bacterium RBG_16_62_13]|uniref:Type II secretion system core protein G n=1 Tax=Candidatus Muproteobacteria bacterium RBG_16_62_13 TaxID=1817756 RepID=A0A1F6T7X8_9PROT|nr:MAG: type II secretion system protein GspG [Candidatus Muproteobacteria bacterium RBG_16_62_13]